MTWINLARLTALYGKRAMHSVEAQRATARVQTILKGAVAAIGTDTFVAAQADLQQLSEAFATSLIGVSVFDTILKVG